MIYSINSAKTTIPKSKNQMNPFVTHLEEHVLWHANEAYLDTFSMFSSPVFDIITHWGPFCQHGLTLIPVGINNYTQFKVCDEITDPFPNVNAATVADWEWVSIYIPHFTVCVLTLAPFTNMV